MPFAWTECRKCGSKRRSYFTPDELERLRRHPHHRFCRFCHVATLWVPVEPPGKPAEAPLPAATEVSETPSVLVIDDDEDTLAVLRKALTAKGFYVEAADSGRIAISKLVNENFDAILADIHMPGFDGKKLFLFIQQYMPEHFHRLMFVTGDTENPATRRFLEETGRPFAYKPVDFEQLVRQIERLAGPRPRPTNRATGPRILPGPG